MKGWIHAARLRTLPLAASCSLMGSALAWREGKGDWLIFIGALITTFLLQILSNFANDYGDHTKGVDNAERIGPQRALQSGQLSAHQMKRGLVIATLITLLSGMALLWLAFHRQGLFLHALVFLALGIAAIIAAFKYTMGKNPYGYIGLGDAFVFVFFGIVGVCGTYYLYTHQLNGWVILPATTIGCLSTAVLNLNNLRDHVNDAASGKRTLVVLMGFDNGKIYQAFLFISALISLSVWLMVHKAPLWHWVVVLPCIGLIMRLRKIISTTESASLDPELKRVALSTFVLSLMFFIIGLF